MGSPVLRQAFHRGDRGQLLPSSLNGGPPGFGSPGPKVPGAAARWSCLARLESVLEWNCPLEKEASGRARTEDETAAELFGSGRKVAEPIAGASPVQANSGLV